MEDEIRNRHRELHELAETEAKTTGKRVVRIAAEMFNISPSEVTRDQAEIALAVFQTELQREAGIQKAEHERRKAVAAKLSANSPGGVKVQK